jgi:hypothetical protein
MSETKVLAPLLSLLADLIAWLKTEEVAGVVIGGLAASLLGRPRLTRDVDVLVVVDEGRWAGFLATGAEAASEPLNLGSPTSKTWVARIALFKAPLGLPLGLPDCPALHLVIAVFLLFFQESLITYCP